MSDDERAATGPGLTAVLRDRIARDGPLTFEAFMETALYDPEHGFFSRLSVGEAGHFVTSPHVSPVFGILVARQVEEFWELLGRPDPFIVVEVGAGDGTLAGQILGALSPEARRATRYRAVERAHASREALAAAGIDAVADLDGLEAAEDGCVLANELLDNLPFHRVRRTAQGLAELYVAWEGDRFGLTEGPLSSPDVAIAAAAAADLPVGGETVVSPRAVRFVDQARSMIRKGYLWIADYAADPADPSVSVHGYLRHGLEPDVLTDPGSRDITAGVDFEAVRRRALETGLPVWGPVSQREALLALGFRDLDRRAQERQQEAIAARRGIDAMRIYSNRTRANMLVANGGLGEFRVLCAGLGMDVPPRSVRASVW